MKCLTCNEPAHREVDGMRSLWCKKCEDKRLAEAEAKTKARLDAFRLIPPFPKMPKAVIVWAFDDAPDVYRNMADCGNGDTWIALVPPSQGLYHSPAYWLDKLDTNSASRDYEIADGYSIYIGSHA